MKAILACLLGASTFLAVAQNLDKAQPQQPGAATASCPDCGVVRSVRSIKKELRPDDRDDSKPSGLVASVPLGSGKPTAGSSTRIGKDVVPTSETWEIIVGLEDGRMRVLTVSEPPEVRQGDKVRVEPNGRITLRSK